MKVLLIVTLWREFTWRHWRREAGSTALLLAILALGVGVFFSIRLANRAAVAGFGLFTENLSGESDYLLSSDAGTMPEEWLPEMREVLGDLPLALFPVVETTATDAAADGTDGFSTEQFRVMGLDLFALPNLIYLTEGKYRPPVEVTAGDEGELEPERRTPVFITKALAARRGLAAGDGIDLIFNDTRAEFTVGGILPEPDLQTPHPASLMLMDLPEVQRLSGTEGKVGRVEVRVPPGALAAQWREEGRALLEAAGEGRWRVSDPEVHRASGEEMTRAFRLNLTILSCLALLVGVYLILQALEAAVVKRRSEIGVLRSLGVEPRAIRTAWLVEALALGMAGSLVGLLSGWAGAQFAVRAVAQTVNSLYFSTTTSAAGWHWGEAGLALGVGLAASVVAGWLPARDAARTPPAEVLQRGARGGGIEFLKHPGVGLALVGVGVVAALLPPVDTGSRIYVPLGGYVAALCWVVGGSVLAGKLFRPLAGVLCRWGGDSGGVRYAASHLRRPTGRHRLASAGVVIAVAMAAGMSILVGSFEHTVTAWIDRILRADLYVSCQGAGNVSSGNRIAVATWKALAKDEAVVKAEVGQSYAVSLGGARVFLEGVDFGDAEGWKKLVWLEKAGIGWEEFDALPGAGEVAPVLVNETFRYRFGVAPGDAIAIPTPGGVRSAKVVGIYADYASERGTVMVSRRSLAGWFEDERAATIALYLRGGEDAEKVRRRFMESFGGLMIRTNRLLREEAIRIFHQTFLVTHALKWIALAVAVAGQGLAMISILLDRRRELATLNELGMTRREIAQSVALEGAGVAAAGAVGGVVLSLGLGYLLIEVINRQSFGWTLTMVVPVAELAMIGAVVVAAGWVVARVAGGWGAWLPSEREE